MDHRDVVARYTSDGSFLVVTGDHTGRLAAGPWDIPPFVDEPPSAQTRTVRVCHLPATAAPEALDSELRRDGDDVLVVLLAHEPAELPVGPLVAQALRHGHRVVEASPISGPLGRTAIVLTRDPKVPMTAYLVGTPLSGDDAVRRAMAEYAIEGLAIRAQRAKEAAERARMVQELAKANERAAEAIRRAEAAESAMAQSAAQLAQLRGTRGAKLRRRAGIAITEIRREPITGTARVAKQTLRTLRRRS